MCAMCGSYPCVNRCPNAPEPVPVHKCSKCGYGIIEDMTVKEFMELIGETFSTAEKEE